MSAGCDDEKYLHAFDHVVAPRVQAFEPELVLVSAGFDAHEADPLAGMRVTESGFRELAQRCVSLAPRTAAVLEGGYNLETLPGLVVRRSKASPKRNSRLEESAGARRPPGAGTALEVTLRG